MSTEKGSVLSKKNDSMLTVVALLLGLVAGIVIYQMTDAGILVVLYTIILVFGIYYLATLPFASNEADYVPSGMSFRLVWGALLTTIGLLLLVNEFSGIDLWIMVVILLIVIVIIVLFLFMNKKG